MKRLFFTALVAALSLPFSMSASADHGRYAAHGAQIHHHHYYVRDHRGKPPKHRRHHRAHRHSRPAHRVVEHHYYAPPRYDHHYRGHTDVPLVTVGGYPVVRIPVNH